MRATSSEAARNSMATQYSPTISLTEGPIMWTPSTSSVVGDAIDTAVHFVVALREAPELIIGSCHPLDKRDLLRKLIS